MQVRINGEDKSFPDEKLKISTLLERIEVSNDRVATMVNGEIVKKPDRGHRLLSDGDEIELLTFAGGG